MTQFTIRFLSEQCRVSSDSSRVRTRSILTSVSQWSTAARSFCSPCGSLHAGDTDVSNPTRWLILTGSGYACAKVAVCPEQPSHFNSHPQHNLGAHAADASVVATKPTAPALWAANVIIVWHVSHLMKKKEGKGTEDIATASGADMNARLAYNHGCREYRCAQNHVVSTLWPN